MKSHALVSGFFLCLVVSLAAGKTVSEALSDFPHLSEFQKRLTEDRAANLLSQIQSCSLFAPTNTAIKNADQRIVNMKESLVQYHLVLQVIEKNVFPTSVSTLKGGSVMYLTYINTAESESSEKVLEYYANNAKILEHREYQAEKGAGKQILYIIDEVLEPFSAKEGSTPNAKALLIQPSTYGLTESLGAFSSRVRAENQQDEFEKVGNHTFFIPVGSQDSEPQNRLREIDALVIKGHVIPNQVLFTRTMGAKTYHSDSYTKELKVEISLVNNTSTEINDLGYSLKVKSNTLQSDQRHKKGVVLSKIVRANIPVKNGVVHLIENPLMIIDTNVFTFFKNEERGRLSIFFDFMNHAPDFRFEVQANQEKTVFAPNDEAFQSLGAEKIDTLKANISALTHLLRLHMVMGSVSSDDVRSERVTDKYTYDNTMKIYLRVLGDDNNRTLHVQGGGVNAVAVQADIGAIDGIIHVIDRVLGMPYLNVYETIKGTETDLNETYQLGKQEQWLDKLKDMKEKFTFFAPSDVAWKELDIQLPSAYKQLKMGSYSYHTKKILDRHLVVGKELSKNALMNMEEVQTVNSLFKIKRGQYPDQLFVCWEGYEAKIIRPDVHATNGIIHIIERVMMKKRDLIKNAASFATASSVALTMLSTALMLITVVKL